MILAYQMFINHIVADKLSKERIAFRMPDFLNGTTVYLPKSMLRSSFFRILVECGSFSSYMEKYLAGYDKEKARLTVVRNFLRLRCRHDVVFFAGCYLERRHGKEPVTITESSWQDIKLVHKMIFTKGLPRSTVEHVARKLGWIMLTTPIWLFKKEGMEYGHLL